MAQNQIAEVRALLDQALELLPDTQNPRGGDPEQTAQAQALGTIAVGRAILEAAAILSGIQAKMPTPR